MKLDYCKGKYNPFEINKIFFDKRSGFVKLIPKNFKKNNILWVIVLSIYHVVREIIVAILNPCKISFKDLYNNNILFVLPSVNNLRSLQKLIEFVKIEKNNVRVATQCFFSRLYAAVMSIFYLPKLWREFHKRSNEEKRLTLYYVSYFVLTPGLVRFYFRTLNKYRPECVVLSNDHINITKSLELVCEDLGIRTIYVQHASVSYAFPELHFTYSFLDGEDSYIKYTAEGKKCTGQIFVLGAARYDSLSEYRIHRKNSKRNCIGIAINLLDDNQTVNNFCNEILTKYPNIKIKVRVHPALKNKPFVFDNKDRILYTCATDENIIEYLDSIDFQISGDSGVHFDAIIGGVNTVAYNFSKSLFTDNYQYVKNGFIKYAETIEQVMEYSSGKPDVSTVRYYDESYQKMYAGRCSKIIAEFILGGYDPKKIEILNIK